MDCEICTRQLSFIEYERSLRLGFREGVCGGCLEVDWPVPSPGGVLHWIAWLVRGMMDLWSGSAWARERGAAR